MFISLRTKILLVQRITEFLPYTFTIYTSIHPVSEYLQKWLENFFPPSVASIETWLLPSALETQ